MYCGLAMALLPLGLKCCRGLTVVGARTGLTVRHSSTRVMPSQMPNLMDIGSRWIFNEDHDLFRTQARKFMREELAPAHAQFEETGTPTREIWRRMGEQGLLGVR